MERRVLGLSAFLALCTLALVGVAVLTDLEPPAEPDWRWLPFLAIALAAAEQLRVQFRSGEDVDSITLFEAVLAPLILAFPTPAVVGTVAVVEAATALWRRSEWMKLAFNVAMWSLAAAVGSVVLSATATGPSVSARTIAWLLVALTCVALVNNVSFTAVLSISSGRPWRAVLRGFAPVIGAGWIAGWAVNLLMGLLFVLAYVGHPGAVLLFPVPLAMLHLAYRGYANARVDRLRLSGLREAAHALAEPIDPREAIDGFLRATAKGFEARAVALVLVTESGDYETNLLVPDGSGQAPVTVRPASAVERLLARSEEPVRVATGDGGTTAVQLAGEGWRQCLCAPLVADRRPIGAVLALDLAGLESTTTADLAVLEALARETAHTFARGRLFESVLEERRKLDQIVSTTSDGIFTLGEDGAVLTWNAACERITGLAADTVLGQTDLMRRIQPQSPAGAAVDLRRPAPDPALPVDVQITTVDGRRRLLSCAVSAASGAPEDPAAVVVVARDVTPAEEYEQLRGQLDELQEAQAAQRLVVEHLQRAVAPEPPNIEGAEVAVTYVASDPSSPTGGDLYDWQLLPSGELHVAVIDVLGHGVKATKTALTLIHTLRFVTVQGTELEDVVRRTDELLDAQETELVATVVVARYHPSTGEVRIVSGGHPPPLLVDAAGVVTQLTATGGAIGWPGAGSDKAVTARLEVGESLILYTDGLIEARKDIIDGMDKLARHASDLHQLPAKQLADELVTRSLAGADRLDDSLALVVRRAEPA